MFVRNAGNAPGSKLGSATRGIRRWIVGHQTNCSVKAAMALGRSDCLRLLYLYGIFRSMIGDLKTEEFVDCLQRF